MPSEHGVSISRSKARVLNALFESKGQLRDEPRAFLSRRESHAESMLCQNTFNLRCSLA